MKARRTCVLATVVWILAHLAAPAAMAQTFSARRAAQGKQAGLQFREVKVGAATHRFEVYVPQGWTKEREWPVILMLHGAGLRGEYAAGQRESVIGKLFLGYQKQNTGHSHQGQGGGAAKTDSRFKIQVSRREFPFVVVFPRCPPRRSWTEPEMEEVALAALEQSIREFRGDRARVYLTGLSMGGYGTWYIAARRPEMFAAIAPVCPGVRALAAYSIPAASAARDPYADLARRIGKVPVWVFHGALDDQIDVSESRRMVAALQAAGASVRYTEYQDVRHNAWERAYADPAFFAWLLAHRRGQLRSPPRPKQRRRSRGCAARC